MNEREPMRPPRWAERFLSWYCRPSLLEDLQGDLNEYFQRNVKTRGARRARLIYILDVLKFLRLYTIRKPDFVNLLIHRIMISSYIKTSGRSIVRHKLFSSINIIGMAISMSVGLLVLAFVSDLMSYDDFHENKERIYRVYSTNAHNGERHGDLSTTSVKAGKWIRETATGVDKVTLLRRGFGGDAVAGEKIIPLTGLWADNEFFKVFSFKLLQGNAATALKEPFSLVLTETSAKKLFGDTDVLGKSVRFDTIDYVVTGIMKDVPKLSHMRFEALVSFSTVELQKPDMDGGYMSWENFFSNYTYLLLPENGDPQTVQASLDKLCASENAALDGGHGILLQLQPLKEIPMHANMGNPIGPGINKIALWVLGGLALIIILSACFNYTNLSIARSLRRSREVGIRKVVGAYKSHVLSQFMVESVIIALLALMFSFLLFLFLRLQFISLAPNLSDLISLELSPRLVISFIVLALVVGVIAGFLPALFFSRINAIQVLKDVSTLKVFRHVNMRKALIVVQYFFSLVFITATVIGFNQYKSLLTFDLGFTTENIVNIKLQGNKADLVKKELSALPAVQEISQSVVVTSLGNIYGTHVKYHEPDEWVNVWLNVVDEHYLPLHKHKLIAGRNFNTLSSARERDTTAVSEENNVKDGGEVIVNERVLKRFNIGKGDPDKAIGEQLITNEGTKITIVGVLKDFHYGSLENSIEPVIIRYSPDPNYYLNVKVVTNDWNATLTDFETAWKKIDKVHPIIAEFYDQQIEQSYKQFSVMVKVIGFLAVLAIGIASMGLFGMVVFTTETRLKEISIRKVLGASEGKLIFLLSKGFLFLLTLSALVALPVTYFFFDKVVLRSFIYHQPITLTEMLTGTVVVMAIAFLMIGSQTLKVARSNPAEVLKTE